jgi:hypothetical protein
MESKTGPQAFYMAAREEDIFPEHEVAAEDYHVEINKDYWLKKRNIIIVGHNSKSRAIMDGFDAFRDEWNLKDGTEILNIIVIDDKDSLKKYNYFADYPYVNKVVEADVYDKEVVYDEIGDFIEKYDNPSILILSDDMVQSQDYDAAALIHLIYVRDIIDIHQKNVNVVVEIINPKNYDVVRSYSVNNVVISNRYISKLATQLGEKEALFEFYNDILTYDAPGCEVYVSKELYIKEVSEFFKECPGKTTAETFIRAVYEASPEENKSIVLGYVDVKGQMFLFDGDQRKKEVELTKDDKVIVFSNH